MECAATETVNNSYQEMAKTMMLPDGLLMDSQQQSVLMVNFGLIVKNFNKQSV